MQARLPKVVLNRSKSGFNAPVSAWLRGSLRPLVEELMAAPSSLFDVSQPLLGRLWRDHLSGARDDGFRLWCLSSLLLWEREVAKAQAQPKVPDP
jgi:asparagine synthase (glutamine-hydrolysing)